jgi:hypothetical protein
MVLYGTRISVIGKVNIAFGSAILTLIVVGAMSYRALLLSGTSARWVRHTLEVPSRHWNSSR